MIATTLLLCAVGCTQRASWNAPGIVRPAPVGVPETLLETAELALAEGMSLEQEGAAACVDAYYQSAKYSWLELSRRISDPGSSSGRAGAVYRSSLAKLVTAGQHFGRLDPAHGLVVSTEFGPVTIPTRFHGFTWQPDDFDRLVPVGNYSTRDLDFRYACCGAGLSTVVIRCRNAEEPFFNDQQLFSATVLLRSSDDVGDAMPDSMVLEFYDPLRVSSQVISGHQIDLQRDLTAPFAYRLSQQDREYLKEFLQPGSTSEGDGLFMLEPYQPGKIPVVFVHGLLSDPLTWINMVNQLRAHPELLERYQIWGYEYPTGEPFLTSAARLRRQLTEIQSRLDPECGDQALTQMVLVGHSMGGLVANLQITCSGDALWNSVSCVPLEAIATTPETRANLAEAFYFDPSPMVSRVVFIGTPHRGSPRAKRPAGRLGARLVDESETMKARHRQLLRDNPGVFSKEFTRRVPTSIDLLKPESPLLRAASSLSVSDRVAFHTIYGSGYWLPGAGNSDRVVPVHSALKSGAISDQAVHAQHTKLNRNPASIDALFRILQSHLQELEPELEPEFREN